MMDRRLRLLVLSSTFPRWRGDSQPPFVADLCRGLRDRMDVTVLAPGSDGALGEEDWDGVRVVRFRYGWPAGTQRLADGAILPNIRRNRLLMAQVPMFIAAELIAAIRLTSRERFDAIHAHWLVPQGAVATMLRLRRKLPVLLTAHGSDVYGLRQAPIAALKRRTLASSDGITAVSEALKREVVALGAAPERVHVLPMGVDCERFSPERASGLLSMPLRVEGPLIIFVGRLVEKKGVRYLIDAMPAVLRRHPRATLLVIGDGPESGALAARASALGLEANVRFLGAVPNEELAAYYAAADVFVGPSVVEQGGDTESFGVVFAEAMASGCPVVTTDVGGIADVTGEGEYALVVPPRDGAAIADAVCRLLEDSAYRDGLRDRALRSVRARFDHRRIHAAYGDIIEQIAA